MEVININFENKSFETDEGVIYPLVFNVENSITLNEFQEFLNEIVNGKVTKLVIEHKDRLTRFQFNFIEKIYKVFGCEIVVLEDKEDVSDAEDLTRDLMALLASFSGKYYGKRSINRRKKK